MPVIWREDLSIRGKLYPARKIYRSSKMVVTEEDEKQAERLDRAIASKIKRIKTIVQSEGLLDLKKRRGVLKLWYIVGKNIQFIDDERLLPSHDKHLVWEAIWYHVEKIVPGLIPGKQKKRRGTYRDHFIQCYRVAKFPWVTVEKGGNWSEWQEFFDATTINEDSRILKWIIRKVESEDLDDYWLKRFYRLLKRRLSGKVTEVFSEQELFDELQRIWEAHKKQRV